MVFNAILVQGQAQRLAAINGFPCRDSPRLRVFRCSTKRGDGRGAVALDLRGIALNGSLMLPYLAEWSITRFARPLWNLATTSFHPPSFHGSFLLRFLTTCYSRHPLFPPSPRDLCSKYKKVYIYIYKLCHRVARSYFFASTIPIPCNVGNGDNGDI